MLFVFKFSRHLYMYLYYIHVFTTIYGTTIFGWKTMKRFALFCGDL